VIRCLWSEGVPGGQIHQRTCAFSHRVVYEQIMFKKGCASVTDAERSGRPTTPTTI
jgi:hypothetical protein